MKKTKTEIAVEYFKSYQYKKSFSIFAKFRLSLTKKEQRSIQIANETFIDKSKQNFYTSIGVDWQEEIKNALEIIKIKFIK